VTAAFGGKTALEGKASLWTHVREYAGAPAGPYPVWVNGRRQADFRDVVPASGAPPANLQARHALPLSLPRWDQQGVVNVREAPYLAKGDGRSDDTAALERAIAEHDTLFLPKGVYLLSRPLQLRARTRLFGVAQAFTGLAPVEDAPAFSNAAAPRPLVDTPDDRGAGTVVARLRIDTAGLAGARSLRWRAGRSSVVFNLRFGRTPSIVVEGNGGGRWFDFFFGDTRRKDPDYRLLSVRGTREPLVFYMFDPEHARSGFMTEFVDARNVTLYALKGETHEIGHQESGTRPLMLVKNSRNFRIYGPGGIMGAAAGHPPYIFRFENCTDFLIANEGHQQYRFFADPSSWSALVDVSPAGEVKTPGSEYFVLYKRGAASGH